MNINEFFTWLATGAGATAAVSFIVERIPKWHELTSEARSWIGFAGSTVIALGSYAVLTYVPKDVLTALAPFFGIVAGVAGIWMAGLLAHKADPARDQNP